MFCLAETRRVQIVGRAGHPPEPDAGEKRLRRRSGLQDDVGREAPEALKRVFGEAELPVGDVLHDQEPVPAGELDELLAPAAGETDPGRVLVVGDRVDELGPQPIRETPFQVVHVEPVVVQRNGDERRLEAPERLDRAQVGRTLDDDDVAGVQERLADQLERLDRAARDQQLVLGGAAPLRGCRAARRTHPASRPDRAWGAYWNALDSPSAANS